MSQVKNKVRWCLNKAKKELEEGKSHRGLIEVKLDIKEAKDHIKKAEHNLKAVEYNIKGGFSDWAISAVFYTIYHCFLGIIAKFGYESRNQECTVALIQSLKEEGKIEISKDIIDALQTMEQYKKKESNVIELREDFQYGTATVVEQNRLSELKELCKLAIEESKKIIYGTN